VGVCLAKRHLWKVQRDYQIASVAVIVAVGVNTDGRREVLGSMTVGHSEGEPFWVEFPACRAGVGCAAPSW
jgi:transposase-like protein